MQAWEKWLAAGGALTAVGAILIFGYTRGWFSNHYDSTKEGGEGAAALGGIIVAAGVVLLIIAGIEI